MGNFSFDPVLGAMARQILDEQFSYPDRPEPDENQDRYEFAKNKNEPQKASRSWLNQILGWFYPGNIKAKM